MAFNFSIRLPERTRARIPVDVETEDLDSPDVIIAAASMALAEADARFHVEGFGESDWNLDVRYDMSIFLEQIPNALHELNSGNDFEIEIYSQGVERILAFHIHGGDVNIVCRSGTAWVPRPSEEVTTTRELVVMFTKLAVDFARAVLEVDETSIRLDLIRDWSRGEVFCS